MSDLSFLASQTPGSVLAGEIPTDSQHVVETAGA